jgi:hypothetical protein
MSHLSELGPLGLKGLERVSGLIISDARTLVNNFVGDT